MTPAQPPGQETLRKFLSTWKWALQRVEATGLQCLPPFTNFEDLSKGTAAALIKNGMGSADVKTVMFGSAYTALILHQYFVKEIKDDEQCPMDFKAAYSPKQNIALYKALTQQKGTPVVYSNRNLCDMTYYSRICFCSGTFQEPVCFLRGQCSADFHGSHRGRQWSRQSQGDSARFSSCWRSTWRGNSTSCCQGRAVPAPACQGSNAYQERGKWLFHSGRR